MHENESNTRLAPHERSANPRFARGLILYGNIRDRVYEPPATMSLVTLTGVPDAQRLAAIASWASR